MYFSNGEVCIHAKSLNNKNYVCYMLFQYALTIREKTTFATEKPISIFKNLYVCVNQPNTCTSPLSLAENTCAHNFICDFKSDFSWILYTCTPCVNYDTTIFGKYHSLERICIRFLFYTFVSVHRLFKINTHKTQNFVNTFV